MNGHYNRKEQRELKPSRKMNPQMNEALRTIASFLIALIIIGLLMMFLAPLAYGGGLDRIMVTGPTGVGNGSDPDGPWIPENLGSKIQIKGDLLEFGTEVMIPKFTIKNAWGKKLESKSGVVHILPYINYGKRIDEDRVIGVEISTQFGMGGSFDRSYGRMGSKTLVSGTYIKKYVVQRLSDKLSFGVALNVVYAQLVWRGPLDINRHYLPIEADTSVSGLGAGYEAALFYQPEDNLAFGISYATPVTAGLVGRTEILRPFKLRHRVKSCFEFPDRLTLSAAWKITPRWLVVADWNYYGYSKHSQSSVPVKFIGWPLTKSVKTDWRDNFVAHIGTSYKVSDRLTVGGGFAYMSKAIPDKTVDFMTPDVAGVGVAGRVKYKVSDDFDLTVGLSRGWGSNRVGRTTVKADIWTVALSGTVRF